jgi:hypothetical protein
MVPKTLRRTMDAILIAVFLGGILAPTIDLLARPDIARSALRENRKPWPFPARITGLTTLSKFPPGFENWFEDRFGLRDQLLRANQALRLFVFHTEASPTLVEGKDGWFFFGADNSIPVQRGLAPLTEEDLERWRLGIEARRDWLRERGIEFAFVIVPNKQSVYPELLPEPIRRLGPTRLEQLTAWMSARSDARFLDLTEAMIAEKSHDAGGDFVYYPLGSHWGGRGAWAGWNAIVASFEGTVPGFAPLPREAFTLVGVPESATDSMAIHTYIPDLVHQAAFSFDPIRRRAALVHNEKGEVVSASQPDETLPSLVLIHDSFGMWLVNFAAETVSRMSAIWEHGFRKDAIEAAQPDVVVQVYTERLLVWGLPELLPDAQILDASAFAALESVWGPLDFKSGPTPPAEGGMRASRTEGGLALERKSSDGVLVLPEVVIEPGAELALRVDITSRVPTHMAVFYQLADDRQFKRSRAASVPLKAGRNEICFRVRAPGVGGGIKLHVGANGTYVLHAIEARSAR